MQTERMKRGNGMICRISPSFKQLKNPLPLYSPRYIYYRLLGLLLESVGRLSKGIDTGFTHGSIPPIVSNTLHPLTENFCFDNSHDSILFTLL